MERGFLSQKGYGVGRGVKEKESNGTKRNTTSGIGLSSKFDDTMNVDTVVGVAFTVKEGVTSSVVDKMMEMEKISSLEDTAIPESFPPLSTMVTTTAGNAPGKSSYANITGKPSGKKVSVRTLFTPGGNGIDVVVLVDSIHVLVNDLLIQPMGFSWERRGHTLLLLTMLGILGKWHPDENLLKEDVSTVLDWVKLHGVLVTDFNEDGLSAITTKLELKDNIFVAMPKIIREGHYTCNSYVEYEWKPPSGNKKKGVEPTIEVSNSNPSDVLNSVDNDVKFGTNGGTTNLVNNVATSSKLRLLDNDGKPLVPTGIVESDSEVEVVFDETANLMISTSGNDETDKGQPKKKKAKKAVFTFYIMYDGIFTSWPLKYAQGEMKEVNDSNFDEMSYEHLLEIVKRLVPHCRFKKVYYCQTGAKLCLGIREITSNQDIVDMLKTEGDDSVVIKNISTEDSFLNKLCSSRIMFRGQREEVYPVFNPDVSWDKMEPMLGMRHVVEGRCVGEKGNKDKLMPIKVRTGVSKGKHGNKVVEKKAARTQLLTKKDLGIHGLGLVILTIGKKLVVVLVGVVETVPVSSTRIS
nr:ATPase, F1/V1/A1 complex, alpha/beta subunit, zinc knuckle CX2CX4HX4C [Tanacetum cinerariifolium]